MQAALLQAVPGESPVDKLMSLAQRLGVEYDGVRWHMDHQRRRVLRRIAEQLGVEPPEPLDEMDIEFEELALRQEVHRRARARERMEHRFRHLSANGGRQALFDGHGAALARLAELDAPVTPETLAWAQALPEGDPLPVDAHVPDTLVEAMTKATRAGVRAALRSLSKARALTVEALDLARPVAGVTVSAEAAREMLGDLTPVVHRRAEIKRQLVKLWARWLGCREFPERCPDDPWQNIAWLTFAGYALPPVYGGQQRWDARTRLNQTLDGTGLDPSQLRATLEVARRVALAEAIEQFVQALR